MKLNRLKSYAKRLLNTIKWLAVGYIAATLLTYAGIIAGVIIIAIAAYLGINNLINYTMSNTIRKSVF